MIKRTFLFIAFFALAFFIYRNGLHTPYCYDDYEHLFVNPHSAIVESFSRANVYAHFYRPIEKLVLAVIQTYWGWDTLPIHLLHILLHAAAAFLVFHSLRKWKVNSYCALAGSLLVLVSQLSVYAVASNDTQSQIESSIFSALSLWLLYRYLDEENRTWWKYALSIFIFFLALLSKETGAGVILGIVFLLLSLQNYSASLLSGIKKSLLLFLPYCLFFLIYWLMRLHAGGSVPGVGSAHYAFEFGLNIFKNIGLFLIHELLPVASMTVMKTLYYHQYVLFVLIFVYTGIFTLLFGYGLWKSQRRKIVLGLCILMFFSWWPAIFLGARTSELYPYNSVLYLGALFGIAVEYYLLDERRTVLRFGAILTFVVVLITNIIGADKKTTAMNSLGVRSDIFLPQIISYAKTLPQNAVMYLVNPTGETFHYSEFSMIGFRAVAGCDSLVRFYAHRPDFQSYYDDSAGCAESSKNYPGVAFGYDSTSYHIYPIVPNFTGTGIK